MVVLNFYFYLPSPFYFLKWNHYFSACERKFAKFFMSCLKTQVSFPSNFVSIFSVMKHNFSVLFSSKITYFGQKQSIKVQMFEIFERSVEIRQIPYVSFELTSQFLFNFASFIILTTHNSSADFKLIHFLLCLKGSHQSLKDFPVLWWKFVKSYISFLKAQVSFPSDFESILSAVKHNSSVLF